MPVLGLVRRGIRRLGAWPDRLLHQRRSARAIARARRRGKPASVVMVCYGNICRSPFAEVSLRRCLGAQGINGITVESAGVYGPDRPANDQARRLAGARGLDLDGHRSQLFAARHAETPALVLVMTREQQRQVVSSFGVPEDRIELLGDFDPLRPGQRDIPDPYGYPDEVFEQVFDRIERCIGRLCLIWKGTAPQ